MGNSCCKGICKKTAEEIQDRRAAANAVTPAETVTQQTGGFFAPTRADQLHHHHRPQTAAQIRDITRRSHEKLAAEAKEKEGSR